MSARPVPPTSALTEPYWEAARRGEFVVQRCDDCGHRPFPPRATCPACGSKELPWAPASGRGRVHTFTVQRRPPHRTFADRLPTVTAIVELDEGPRMISEIVGCDPETVEVGMAVTVAFDSIDDTDLAVPVFRPSEGD